MRFLDQSYLMYLLIIPFLLVFTYISQKKYFKKLKMWIPKKDLKEKFSYKYILFFIAMTLLLLAYARPQWGTINQTVTISSNSTVFVFDISKSMLAEDVSPNRLERAKYLSKELMKKIGGNRIGLVAFAGNAFLISPITTDAKSLSLYIETISTEISSNQGTDLGLALKIAKEAFERADVEGEYAKTIVLFSDGEDFEGDVDLSIKELKTRGIQVISYGFGSFEGAPIPFYAETGRRLDFIRTGKNEVVTTRLDEDTLSKISEQTNGLYYKASLSGYELDEIAKFIEGKKSNGETQEELKTEWAEKYYYFLAAAVLILTFLYISSFSSPFAGILLLLVSLLISFPSANADDEASPPDASFLQKDETDKAQLEQKKKILELTNQLEILLKKYSLPSVNFNLGNAHLALKEPEMAVQDYKSARVLAGDGIDINYLRILYNLGKAYQILEMYKEGATSFQEIVDLGKENAEYTGIVKLARQNLEILAQQQKQSGQGNGKGKPDKNGKGGKDGQQSGSDQDKNKGGSDEKKEHPEYSEGEKDRLLKQLKEQEKNLRNKILNGQAMREKRQNSKNQERKRKQW